MPLPVIRFARLPVGGAVPAGRVPASGGGAAAAPPAPRRPRAAAPDPAELEAREMICRTCERLDDDHCTHPGCPHCWRHPDVRGPWKTVKRCPAGKWGF